MLKKDNYTFTKFNQEITVPVAYAMIEDFYTNYKTGTAKALFRIKAVRDLASKEIIDEVWVEFPLVRTVNNFVSAYKTAKGKHVVYKRNKETKEVETIAVNNTIFGDWEDDIVE
jgi:hypothetical protein